MVDVSQRGRTDVWIVFKMELNSSLFVQASKWPVAVKKETNTGAVNRGNVSVDSGNKFRNLFK